MKKYFLLLASTLMAFFVQAQAPVNDPHYAKAIPDKFIEIPALILGAYLAVQLLLMILRMFLDNRLRVKMIERGLSEDLIRPFLQSAPSEFRREALKGICLFAGAALGLLFAALLPAGTLSVALVAAGVSIGFLAYYLLLPRTIRN